MYQARLLGSRTLVRKEYKSIMSEEFRELKWTCPLVVNFYTVTIYKYALAEILPVCNKTDRNGGKK